MLDDAKKGADISVQNDSRDDTRIPIHPAIIVSAGLVSLVGSVICWDWFGRGDTSAHATIDSGQVIDRQAQSTAGPNEEHELEARAASATPDVSAAQPIVTQKINVPVDGYSWRQGDKLVSDGVENSNSAAKDDRFDETQISDELSELRAELSKAKRKISEQEERVKWRDRQIALLNDQISDLKFGSGSTTGAAPTNNDSESRRLIRENAQLREQIAVSARTNLQLQQTAAAALNRPVLQQKPIGSRPVAIANAGSYFDVGGGHWINGITDDGAVVILEDRSIWKIARFDRLTSTHWLRSTEIAVLENDDASSTPYALVNVDDGEKVEAEYAGKN